VARVSLTGPIVGVIATGIATVVRARHISNRRPGHRAGPLFEAALARRRGWTRYGTKFGPPVTRNWTLSSVD
jgi:hypothetical protein